jgi:hypothetical protein
VNDEKAQRELRLFYLNKIKQEACMFFENVENAAVLANFLRKADATKIHEKSKFDRLTIARTIISYMYKSPKEWDDRCSFNIKHVGIQFIDWLRDFDEGIPGSVDNIYCLTYRFLCEFDFLVGPAMELSMEMRSIKSKIQLDNNDMSEDIRSQIVYASYVMPANIAKEFINDANIGVFKNFEARKAEAENLKNQWDEEINAKSLAAEALKNKLDEYKIGFNFVGLYKGFSDLVTRKNSEAFWLFVSLISAGLLILTPLIVEIFFAISGIYNGKTFGADHLMVLIPLISVELILIYFFRIILINHKSVKSQILQIELRQTLCQFIQSYASYSVEIKKQDSGALDKFENLIFSGVISDPEKLPSTFDGVEQLSNIIKRLKG